MYTKFSTEEKRTFNKSVADLKRDMPDSNIQSSTTVVGGIPRLYLAVEFEKFVLINYLYKYEYYDDNPYQLFVLVVPVDEYDKSFVQMKVSAVESHKYCIGDQDTCEIYIDKQTLDDFLYEIQDEINF